MPRLLILCEYPTLLGGERSMLATLSAVSAAGFDICVAAPPAGPLAEILRARGVTHVSWSPHADGDDRPQLERSRDDLAAILRELRPDLVHANSLSTARISGLVTAAAGIPSIGHLRDIMKLSRQAVDDLNRHRRLIAVSRATRDFHIVQGVDVARTVVSHNGVDLDEFFPRPPDGYLHRELNLPPTARFIATIGQLGLRKGTEVALSAALRIAADHPDVHWLVVGERTSNKDESREFESLLRSIAAEEPLAGRVHFLGTRTDIARLMNECTLLVHAARQEPLGRVLLEAAASGLPTIATEAGGAREIFPTESDGALLVPIDHRSALAEAVSHLLRDEPRRQSLAQSARRRAEAAFDIHAAAARLIAHYHDLLA